MDLIETLFGIYNDRELCLRVRFLPLQTMLAELESCCIKETTPGADTTEQIGD